MFYVRATHEVVEFTPAEWDVNQQEWRTLDGHLYPGRFCFEDRPAAVSVCQRELETELTYCRGRIKELNKIVHDLNRKQAALQS